MIQSNKIHETFFSPSSKISLKNIKSSIKGELKDFHLYFKESLKTDVRILDHLVTYLLKTKGKELRPILVLLASKTCSPEAKTTDRTYVAATMVELLHTATLIHDDVVDEADHRRGFLSINKIWRNKAGVLLGDYLLAKGLLVALDRDEFELLKVLSSTVKRMSEGELRQLKASSLQNMTKEKYFEIISGKTASLISACCECGAIASGATKEERMLMQEIGEDVGLAFQIRDDLFDYGIADVGKPIGNDIVEKKITLPLIEAFSQSSETEARKVKRIFAKTTKTKEEIEFVRQFVIKHKGIERARSIMADHALRAIDHLAHFPESVFRTTFEQLIQFVVTRKK